MQNVNFDGIKKTKSRPRALTKPRVKTGVSMDGLRRKEKTAFFVRPEIKPALFTEPVVVGPQLRPVSPTKGPAVRYWHYQRFGLVFTAFALIFAFGSGMWVALTTTKSVAEDAAAVTHTENISAPIPLGTQVVASSPAVSNDMLFNTPIEQLQQYFQSKMEVSALEQRKVKLTEFLAARNSPLAAEVNTIAEQEHWKLILAISFAESTLGKRCYYNNCSGIGGSQIKTYDSLRGWILDFNRLLEKRYKDKTLEQMCGVYVQPCNPNWLLATRQILSALDENGIQ